MLTIVYSTPKSNYRTKDYLSKSSGVYPVEVIEIENPGIMSLTQAYQKGLMEAQNDIIVFVHDDVHFQTEKWGKKLIKMFNESDFGIIGLAGTTDFPASGQWWENRKKMVGIVKHTDGKKTWENKYSGAFPKQILPTVNVDGLFIAVNRKKIKYEFDVNIPGFHFYDVDFTVGNFVKGVKIGVTTDIRVIHRGLGETNQEWDINRKSFLEKFKDNLPVKVDSPVIIHDIDVSVKNSPKIGVIIHGRDIEKIKTCIQTIKEKTKYSNYEIFVLYSDYDDVEIVKDPILDDVKIVNTTSENFSLNSNRFVDEHITDQEILIFMTENVLIQNDVISLGVKSFEKNKHSGTVTARVHNPDNTIYNSGYEVWNIVRQPEKEGKPQSSITVNLLGFGSNYSFRDEIYYDAVGGTKEFFMVKTDLFKRIRFNESYKKSFQDLEFNMRCINDRKMNIVLGNGVVKLSENIVVDSDYNDDLNRVFLPYVYSQDLSAIDKHIKNFIVPVKNEQQ